jgi:hypothetical protein
VLTVIVICLLIGFAKGGLSGIALISVPLLSLTMPTAEAVATVLVLLMVGDVFALWAYWGKWDNRLLWLTLPAGVAGTLLGAYILTQLPDAVLNAIIGVLTLLYVAYRLLADRLQSMALDYDPPPVVGWVAGFVAGMASSLGNAGAPPLAAYLLLKRVLPEVFVAVFAAFFAILNALKLPLFVQSGLLRPDAFLSVIWAAPLIPLGVWLGRRFINWVDPRLFNRLVLLVLFLTGVYLIMTAYGEF